MHEEPNALNPYGFSLTGDAFEAIVSNGDLQYHYWDALIGTWVDQFIEMSYNRRPGEILCYKRFKVSSCVGLSAVREYHQYVFSKLVCKLLLRCFIPRS